MGNKYGNLFADWEIALAKNIIRQEITRNRRLRNEDFDDYLQECLLHWWGARDNYRPDKGASRETYMGKVVRHKILDLIAGQNTNKRKVGNIAESMETPLTADENGRTLGDTISENIGKRVRHQEDEIALVADVRIVLATLPPGQHQVCETLRQEGSVKAAADRLGIPRSTLQDDIQRIRTRFSEQGLENYLR